MQLRNTFPFIPHTHIKELIRQSPARFPNDASGVQLGDTALVWEGI